MSFNVCVHERVEWARSRSPKVNWDHSSPRGTSGTRSITPERELVVKERAESPKT
jgi:hypothetical protein